MYCVPGTIHRQHIAHRAMTGHVAGQRRQPYGLQARFGDKIDTTVRASILAPVIEQPMFVQRDAVVRYRHGQPFEEC
jgi:hypothetical protein